MTDQQFAMLMIRLTIIIGLLGLLTGAVMFGGH